MIFAEIDRRRASGERGRTSSACCSTQATRTAPLSKQELRDQVMTLLFAGHDTTTSTVTFLFYELARNPGDHDLELAIDETLRMYPPAWIGPRRSIEPFELHGVRVPGGVLVNYCSWASHHLAEVFPEPFAVPPRALHRGGTRRASEGRVRAVRRRLAHLHRHALRAARGEDDRDGHPGALPAGAGRAGAPAVDPPDADALAARRPAGDRPRAIANPFTAFAAIRG